jgi:hypothetical protein
LALLRQCVLVLLNFSRRHEVDGVAPLRNNLVDVCHD